MTNMGRPPGLIRYDALAVFESVDSKPLAPKILRPRVLIYSVVWVLICSIGIYQFAYRRPFHAQVFGMSGAKPWFIDGDYVKNLLKIKVGNQSQTPDRFEISIQSESPDTKIRIESPTTIGPVLPGAELAIPLLISVNRSASGVISETITVRSVNTGIEQVVKRRFVGPGS